MILLDVDGNVNLLNVDGNVNLLNVYGFEMASNMAALTSHEIVIFWYRYCEVEVKLNLPNVPPEALVFLLPTIVAKISLNAHKLFSTT